MAKTLLAVDDSVTMRKVLEITFSGEDFRVITADTSQAALSKLAEGPQVCVVDTGLNGEDGYTLARELRKRSPGLAIVMLASRYAPYDQARGREAGADDWADKPFDTQQLIDKIRKVMVAREANPVAAAAPAPAPPPPAPAPPAASPQPPVVRPAAASPGVSRSTQQSLSSSVPRTGTLVFGENAPSAPPALARPAPVAAPPPAPPPPAPVAAPSGAPSPVGRGPAPAPQVSAAVNGHLQGKLDELGLTPQQADAVLALSRDVVERVVWEVVPQLAEALIKEEIARLTKD